MDKIFQEFYCNDCFGFIRFKLNAGLNRKVVVVCPNCGRKHPRGIADGMVHDSSSNSDAEEICPPRSAYFKTSIAAPAHARDGVVISTRDPRLDQILHDSALDRFAGDDAC